MTEEQKQPKKEETEELLEEEKRNIPFIDLAGRIDIRRKVTDKLREFNNIIVLPPRARDDEIEQYIKIFQNCSNVGLAFSKLGNILLYDEETISGIPIKGTI